LSTGPTETPAIRLHGALGSPYSLKMRALMRHRRVPHLWVQDMAARQALFTQVKAPVIPLLQWPDGRVSNDSTVLTRELEASHAGRSVIPENPGHAFLAFLIEDFADEWLTKAMFGYRWLGEADQKQMSRWLTFDSMAGAGAPAQETMAKAFRDRQVGRMALVGCTAGNFPLIEASTRAVLAALEAHVSDSLFLFGNRPSEAEFALFGQLAQLGVDPTPQAMMRADFPLAFRWLAHIDDLSGLDEGQWGPPGPMVQPILQAIGDVYLPFLVANAEALDSGAADLHFAAMGHSFAQPPFRYQAKCLAALRQAFGALDQPSKAAITPLLSATGCLPALKG
jgi:glutathione S-transferase